MPMRHPNPLRGGLTQLHGFGVWPSGAEQAAVTRRLGGQPMGLPERKQLLVYQTGEAVQAVR